MNYKLKYQLLIGKMVGLIGFDKTQELIKEVNNVFINKELCEHKFISVGHQANGHRECLKCGKRIDF